MNAYSLILGILAGPAGPTPEEVLKVDFGRLQAVSLQASANQLHPLIIEKLVQFPRSLVVE